jgi:hypothetical protein
MLNFVALRRTGGTGFIWKLDNRGTTRDAILAWERQNDTLQGGKGSDPHGWRNALNRYGWGTTALTHGRKVYEDYSFASYDYAVKHAVRAMIRFRKPVGALAWAGKHAQMIVGCLWDLDVSFAHFGGTRRRRCRVNGRCKEDHVAVVGGVGRADRSRDPCGGHPGDMGRARLVELRVRRDTGQHRGSADEVRPDGCLGCPRPGKHPSVVVEDVACRVAGHDRTHDRARIPDGGGRRSQAPFIAWSRPAHLPTVAPVPAPTAPSEWRARPSCSGVVSYSSSLPSLSSTTRVAPETLNSRLAWGRRIVSTAKGTS